MLFFKRLKTAAAPLSLAAVFLLTACGGSVKVDGTDQNDEVALYKRNDRNAPPSVKDEQSLMLLREGGDTLAILPSGPTPMLWIAGEKLERGPLEDGGTKRKYRAPDETPQLKINLYDDAFKLKALKGGLLWKVKFGKNKIWIANNEEMEEAYEIRLVGRQRAQIARFGKPLTTVVLSKRRDTYSFERGNRDYLLRGMVRPEVPAVFHIEEMKMRHACVVAAELARWSGKGA
jgi:hypothetical protein